METCFSVHQSLPQMFLPTRGWQLFSYSEKILLSFTSHCFIFVANIYSEIHTFLVGADIWIYVMAGTFSSFFFSAVLSFSFRLLHDGQLLPACSGAEGSASAADIKWKWHALRSVQLLPVQQRRPQPRGTARLRAGQWWAAWHPRMERLRLAWATMAPSGTGSQHILAKWVPGNMTD